jgi:hypothetical protein
MREANRARSRSLPNYTLAVREHADTCEVSFALKPRGKATEPSSADTISVAFGIGQLHGMDGPESGHTLAAFAG